MRNLMNTHALRTLLGTLLVVVALGATACSEAKPEADESKSAASTTESSSESSTANMISDEGYPVDRSLTGLIDFPTVDTIVVITAPKIGEPVFIGPAGANPAKGWADAPGDYIVTPVDATVSEVIRGAAKVGDPIRMLLRGGTIGKWKVVSGEELSPDQADVSKYTRLVIAGRFADYKDEGLGEVLDPGFVYGLDEDSHAVSLLASATIEEPDFTLTELRDAERAR
jgi:hypothetical protein